MKFARILPSVTALLCLCLVVSPLQRSIGAQTAPTDSAEKGQEIEGTAYINHPAHFTLAVPPGWRVTNELMKTTPNAVGTIAAPGGQVAILVQLFDYSIDLETAKQSVESGFSKGFPGYRKTDETPLQIEGDKFPTLTFHFDALPSAVFSRGGGIFAVWIRNGNGVLMFTCEAPEPLFDKSKDTFEKILQSYQYSTLL